MNEKHWYPYSEIAKKGYSLNFKFTFTRVSVKKSYYETIISTWIQQTQT